MSLIMEKCDSGSDRENQQKDMEVAQRSSSLNEELRQLVSDEVLRLKAFEKSRVLGKTKEKRKIIRSETRDLKSEFSEAYGNEKEMMHFKKLLLQRKTDDKEICEMRLLMLKRWRVEVKKECSEISQKKIISKLINDSKDFSRMLDNINPRVPEDILEEVVRFNVKHIGGYANSL